MIFSFLERSFNLTASTIMIARMTMTMRASRAMMIPIMTPTGRESLESGLESGTVGRTDARGG